MSKELTEQFFKATLKTGTYYVLDQDGSIDIDYYGGDNFQWTVVKEVLAAVPSYPDLCELKQELELFKEEKVDLYAKLCNALMQLEDANNVIKDMIGSGMAIADEKGEFYLEKWNVK